MGVFLGQSAPRYVFALCGILERLEQLGYLYTATNECITLQNILLGLDMGLCRGQARRIECFRPVPPRTPDVHGRPHG